MDENRRHLGRLAGAFVITVAGLALAACTADGPDQTQVEEEAARMSVASPLRVSSGKRLSALGAFSCDFALDFTKFVEPLGAEIERDRVFCQRFAREDTDPDNPGMLQKHIPLLMTSDTTAFAGGRYLFQGRAQAAQYADWIKRRFVYPANTQFLDRPEFSDPECRDWTVLTAWRFDELENQTAMRTERFDTGLTTPLQELGLSARLLAAAPDIVSEAEARGYAEVHLLHSLRDHKVQLVYFVPRMSPPSNEVPDIVALGKVSSDAPLGAPLVSNLRLTRVFDRPSQILTIWRPYKVRDRGAPSLWPNSPPVPQPACGDTVCVPSRGENASTCPADCSAKCGDGICQPGESLHTCPTDCELPIVN